MKKWIVTYQIGSGELYCRVFEDKKQALDFLTEQLSAGNKADVYRATQMIVKVSAKISSAPRAPVKEAQKASS